MNVFEKLSETQRQSLKTGVIQVSGRYMNRTALGIVDAMVQLYPKATFEELKQMLPDTINPSAPVNFKSIFKPYSERDYGVIQPGSIREEFAAQGFDIQASHFVEPEEVFRSADGVEILVSKAWESKDSETGQHDLQNLINHVAQYGVRVVEYEKGKPFNKGSYSLEVVNPVLLEEIQNPKKKSFPWWILLLLLALIGGLVFFFMNKKKQEVVVPPPAPVKVEEPKQEGVQGEIAQLKEDVAAGVDVSNRSVVFQDIFFKYNSAEFKAESEADLGAALSLMNEMPQLNVEVIGHTSNEGLEKQNQILSVLRAEAVKKWLLAKGVDAKRITTSGKGSSEPVVDNATEENREKNRRIQFVIK